MTSRASRVGMAVALAMGAASPLGAQEVDFTWRGAMEAGRTLEVRGISGDIRATLASGPEAEVVATKRGRSRDFDLVDIRVFEESDRVVVCALYDQPERDSCDGRGDHDGRRGHSIDVSVDFEVRVPAGVELVGRTVSGDVEAEGLRSDVDASTVSGSVLVSTTGVARGHTVSGEVDVEMGSLDWDRLDFETVSGDITVRVPEGLDAEIDFESLSGDFSSDFDVEVRRRRDRFVGSELQGRIGEGTRQLRFKTVSGDVRLRRAGRL